MGIIGSKPKTDTANTGITFEDLHSKFSDIVALCDTLFSHKTLTKVGKEFEKSEEQGKNFTLNVEVRGGINVDMEKHQFERLYANLTLDKEKKSVSFSYFDCHDPYDTDLSKMAEPDLTLYKLLIMERALKINIAINNKYAMFLGDNVLEFTSSLPERRPNTTATATSAHARNYESTVRF